jgi:hypothetical protein
VADSHAVARGFLTGVRNAAGEFKVPNSPPHAQRSISMSHHRPSAQITKADETSAAF